MTDKFKQSNWPHCFSEQEQGSASLPSDTGLWTRSVSGVHRGPLLPTTNKLLEGALYAHLHRGVHGYQTSQCIDDLL